MTEPILLPTPCWWIDRDDCWEITHHATREDAEAHHADLVRSDYGYPLSVTGAFAIYPGVAKQEMQRCREITCAGCGETWHTRSRITECEECGHETLIIPLDDPDQTGFFEVLPTSDIEGQPLSRVITFEET